MVVACKTHKAESVTAHTCTNIIESCKLKVKNFRKSEKDRNDQLYDLEYLYRQFVQE